MQTFVRAVITGFGFSLGKMIFEKVQKRYLDPESDSEPPPERDYAEYQTVPAD